MFRISSRLSPHVTSKVGRVSAARRLQSSYSSGGGPNKALLAAAGTTTLVGGVVGYSAWSNNNRKDVENTIPGSKYLLDIVLGPVKEPTPPKPPKTEIGLMRRKLEREKKKKKLEEEEAAAKAAEIDAIKTDSDLTIITTEGQLSPPESVEAPAPETLDSAVITTEGQPSSSVSDQAPAPEKAVVSDLEERLAAGEIAQDVENAVLSHALEDLEAQAQKDISAALSAAEDAATAIKQHAEKAYQAISAGQDKEDLYGGVAELSKKRAELIKIAQEKISAAGQGVEKFREQIASGLSSSLTKENKSLITAEETLGELQYALENIIAIVSNSERDGKVVNDYRDLVESGQKEFEAELRSLLPEVKLGETSDKLTTDELNLLIAHAHRKVLQLQKQLAHQQANFETLEHERFKEALTKQREEDTKLLEAKIIAELDRQKQQLEVDYKRKMAQLREELEVELRTQLKRQAAAHSDHLADVLHVQEKELEAKWTNLLQDKVQSEKDKYLASLSKIQGNMDGVKNALRERADADRAAYAARELWLACESLRSALRLGADDSKSWEEQLKPLNEQIAAIKVAAGESNPYIKAVLDSVSGEAINRGVYAEEALRERFLKVERICKRVSMIGDNGGSLIRYLLSYVQSFLILNAFEYLPGTEVRDEEVAVDSLSTYEILARARYCLDKDDLIQSVRYMNLLRGEPRHVASSWLLEARLTLETRQAADALLAHAAATAVKAL